MPPATATSPIIAGGAGGDSFSTSHPVARSAHATTNGRLPAAVAPPADPDASLTNHPSTNASDPATSVAAAIAVHRTRLAAASAAARTFEQSAVTTVPSPRW